VITVIHEKGLNPFGLLDEKSKASSDANTSLDSVTPASFALPAFVRGESLCDGLSLLVVGVSLDGGASKPLAGDFPGFFLGVDDDVPLFPRSFLKPLVEVLLFEFSSSSSLSEVNWAFEILTWIFCPSLRL